MFNDYHLSVKAIICRESKMLLLQADQTIDLPGGRIDQHESPMMALHRELQEELPGISEIEVDRLVGWHQFPRYRIEARSLFAVVFVVRANLPDPIQLSDEHDSAQWVTISEGRERLAALGIFLNSDF